jgi:YegS/Rv2252/BmrU family lipid kinase
VGKIQIPRSKVKGQSTKNKAQKYQAQNLMSLPLVIVNPTSAGGATGSSWSQLASDLSSQFGPFKNVFTAKRGDAMKLAIQACRKGTTFIIACGGDGTISEVANGILNSAKDVEMGILPSGTGGDFRRTLEIPAQARTAARILKTGRTRRIDVGRVSFIDKNGEESSRYFLGVASCGMSTKVIERVKREGSNWLPANAPQWLSGRASFGASLIQTAMRSEPTKIVVRLDESHERRLSVINFCVANARYFGGGMKIAPSAKLADGKFDVISVGDLSALKIMMRAPRLYLGSHLSMSEVSHALAGKVVVRAANRGEEEVALEIDGELPGRLPATFQIIPQALRVRSNA